MTMKACASYFDYVRICTHDDNDYVYLLGINAGGSILDGNYASLQSPDLSDKLKVQEGTFDINISFDDTWDPTRFPTWRSLNKALVFGVFGHNMYDKDAQLTIRWYADNDHVTPYATHTHNFNTHQDNYLDKTFGANDFIVIDNATGSGFEQLVGENITLVRLSFSNDADADTEIGRLWVGNYFPQINDTTQDQVFDGGWSMGFKSIGTFDRNLDNSTGYSKAAPVQRQISIGKSLMPFKQAYGQLYSDSNSTNRNTWNASYSHMLRTVCKFDEVVIIPDAGDNISAKHTAIYGTIVNDPKIVKDKTSNKYSCQVDVLEIVEEQGIY